MSLEWYADIFISVIENVEPLIVDGKCVVLEMVSMWVFSPN
ncbi:MAG: hypothetical protein Q4F45_05120 [Alistipes sp.]|nr:hypothetical protein [Alistipes sp.]